MVTVMISEVAGGGGQASSCRRDGAKEGAASAVERWRCHGTDFLKAFMSYDGVEVVQIQQGEPQRTASRNRNKLGENVDPQRGAMEHLGRGSWQNYGRDEKERSVSA